MSIRCRPIRRREIPECVELIARHPVIGPRYGPAISDMTEVWSRLFGQLAFTSVIFEEEHGTGLRKVATGTRVFVSDRFLAEIKTPPYFWVGPELVRRILAGQSPVLSDRQVREANSGGGLNMFVWDGGPTGTEIERLDVIQTVFVEFFNLHRGFQLKEIITQSNSPHLLEAQLNSGGFLADEKGRYSKAAARKPLSEILSAPHHVGLTRELAQRDFGSWVSSLFVYDAPQFDFRTSEKRLLLAALDGGTDEQLAKSLGVSLSGVKKAWQRIYERVAECNPDLIPEKSDNRRKIPERGKTKKQKLLAYLREHMQELRPA
jgi:hypothetical protein